MIEFGKTLRTARENKGLTIGQLAEATHLTSGMVKDLENEDFSHIAAPIYGRGFIKLYAAATELDPKPLIDEYMAIVNGEHEPTIRAREVAPATEDIAPAAPTPAPEPEPPAPEPAAPILAPESPAPEPTFKLEHEIIPSPKPPEPIPEPEPAPAPEPISEPEPAPAPSFSRYAAPVHQAYESTASSAIWRIGVLFLAALALFILLIFGVRALYRATSNGGYDSTAPETGRASEPAAVTTTVSTPTPASAATTPAAPRATQKIPSLYID